MNKRQFAILVLVLTTLGNLKHFHAVYNSLSATAFENPMLNNVYSLFIVAVFDLAIVCFTLHGNKKMALLFSVSVFLLSISYYMLSSVELHWINIMQMTIFSGMSAISIFEFTNIVHTPKAKEVRKCYQQPMPNPFNITHRNPPLSPERKEKPLQLEHTESGTVALSEPPSSYNLDEVKKTISRGATWQEVQSQYGISKSYFYKLKKAI